MLNSKFTAEQIVSRLDLLSFRSKALTYKNETMNNRIKTASAGMIAYSLGLALVYAMVLPCPNTGIVQGGSSCSTALQCFNHTTQGSCNGTAVTVQQFPNTGTVQGYFIENISTPCTKTVTCTWLVTCQPVAGSEGDTGNALRAYPNPCDTEG